MKIIKTNTKLQFFKINFPFICNIRENFRFNVTVFLIYVAEQRLPSPLRVLNFKWSSASISGNLILAFEIFFPPLDINLLVASTAPSWNILSLFETHRFKSPCVIPYTAAKASWERFGFADFSSNHSSKTLALYSFVYLLR